MSDTLIPTMSLRFVEREGLAPFTMHTSIGGPPEKRMYRVLQQLFRSPAGVDHWRDVPCVNSQGSSEHNGQ